MNSVKGRWDELNKKYDLRKYSPFEIFELGYVCGGKDKGRDHMIYRNNKEVQRINEKG